MSGTRPKVKDCAWKCFSASAAGIPHPPAPPAETGATVVDAGGAPPASGAEAPNRPVPEVAVVVVPPNMFEVDDDMPNVLVVDAWPKVPPNPPAGAGVAPPNPPMLPDEPVESDPNALELDPEDPNPEDIPPAAAPPLPNKPPPPVVVGMPPIPVALVLPNTPPPEDEVARLAVQAAWASGEPPPIRGLLCM